MDNFTYKTTAVALQSRKLVTVSRKGGVWRAAVTPAGLHYLAHGYYPPDPDQGHTSWPTRRPAPIQVSHDAEASPGGDGQSGFEALSPAECLLAQVSAAGGTLEIDRRTDRRNHDTLVAAITRSGKAPPGTQLVIESAGSWEHRLIRLVTLPTWVNPLVDEVPVPATLRAPHRIVNALRKETTFDVSTPTRARALRLVQAIITEAHRRGFDVQPGTFTGSRIRS